MAFVVGASATVNASLASGSAASFTVPQNIASSNLAEGRGARYKHAQLWCPSYTLMVANGAFNGLFATVAFDTPAVAGSMAVIPGQTFAIPPDAATVSIRNGSGVAMPNFTVQFGQDAG